MHTVLEYGSLVLSLHDGGLQVENNNSCLTQYWYPNFCIDMNIAALFYQYIDIVDTDDSSKAIPRGKIFGSARIRTQNSCVTVDHSNHVAKELTQQRGCYEWHCHYTLPPFISWEPGINRSYRHTTEYSPLPLSEASPGVSELLLTPLKQFQGEKSLGPPGFEPRTPAWQSTILTMSLKS